jgi:rapamycin-insensitive companion of mTOR
MAHRETQKSQKTPTISVSATKILCFVELQSRDDVLGGEDFRKALQTANSCIKELEELSKSESALSTASTSKSSTFQTAAAADLNTKRIESMRMLIEILRRHVRVQYQLSFEEILHAYVLL